MNYPQMRQAAWAKAGSGRPLNRQEVHEIANNGLVTIGAHSVTHPALTDLETGAVEREIVGSNWPAKRLSDRPCAASPYKYDDYNDEVLKRVEDARSDPFVTGPCSSNKCHASRVSIWMAIISTKCFGQLGGVC
jgi:hypothetical protein